MPDDNKKVLQLVIESAIRIVVLGLLLYFCLQIAVPFIGVVIWAMIVAIAVYPVYLKIVPWFGGRRGTAATGLVVLTLALFIVPVVSMTGSIVEVVQGVSTQIDAGTFKIPPPEDKVKEWPLVGERLYAFWLLSSENLSEAAHQHQNEIKRAIQSGIGMIGGFGGAMFVFIFATVFAGVFLASGESGHAFSIRLMDRLTGGKGNEMTELCVKTVRSVAQGVIGIAVIQSLLSALGMAMIGVPATALWSVLILVFAIAQLPPLIVLGPVMVWVFSEYETVPAAIFMVYGFAVSVSDAFLKPLLLGRGMDIPMPVILIGAIGGMIYAGIVGLFVGAIVLAIGYSLFSKWLDMADEEAPADE